MSSAPLSGGSPGRGLGRWRRVQLPSPGQGPYRSLWVGLALLALLRLPSLFEPHWYSDESDYATTAWLMSHGKILYLTVWDNKPPVLFWIYQLVMGLFGPSEWGLHLLSLTTGLGALIGTWQLARSYLAPARVWIAVLVGAVLLGTPVFNGDLALPENFLIAFTVWAMVALLASMRATSGRRAVTWAALAGVLFGIAFLIQQTALADLAAGVLVVGWGRRGRLDLAVTAVAAAGLVVVLVMAPFVAAAGLGDVIHFTVLTYVKYTGNSLKPSLLDLAPRGVAALLLLVGAFWGRSWEPERRLPWIWLGALLLAYVLPDRAYLHFLLPEVPAAALLLARIGLRRPGIEVSRARLALAPLLGAVLVSGLLWGGLVGSDIARGKHLTFTFTAQYYPSFVERATGALSAEAYSATYSQNPQSEQHALAWLRRHRLRGSSAVVWGSNVWPYVLGDLHPVLPVPETYNDRAWLGVPQMMSRIERSRPRIILFFPGSRRVAGYILPLLHRSYTEVEADGRGKLWIRRELARRLYLTRMVRLQPRPGRAGSPGRLPKLF
ncbi:MAG: glycosyltransferase family 39 protein [Candidatus Dormiibacterota bacterium]